MTQLPVHIEEENPSDDLDLDIDTIDDLIADDVFARSEIEQKLKDYKTGLEALFALEDYHGTIYGKKTIDARDVSQLNIISNALNVNFAQKDNSFALEGLGSLLANLALTASIQTGSLAVGAAVGAGVNVALYGLVKAVDLSVKVVEKINEGIKTLAAQYETICTLMEKRWFGLKNLVEVYHLQMSKLQDRIVDATKNNQTFRADIRVKLNTAKLARNRKVESKKDYMEIIEKDITDVVTFLSQYVRLAKLTESIGRDTTKSFTFRLPYKQTIVRNMNMFNSEVLAQLSILPLFKDGEHDQLEVHSRVLIGGKRMTVSYSRAQATLEHPRKDLRKMINQMSIYGSRVKGSDNLNVEVVTLRDFELKDAEKLLDLLQTTGEVLKKYCDEGIPEFIKDREFFTRVTKNVTGLAIAGTGFAITKDFLANGDNMEMVKVAMPGVLANSVDLFLKASSLATLVTLVGAKTAGALIDWMRKYIISAMFTSMDLQYRVTKIMNDVDSSAIDTLISVRGQCYRVVDKLGKAKVWN